MSVDRVATSSDKYRDFFLRLTADLEVLSGTSDYVYIYPHVHADGDALASSLAVALLLEQLNVSALVLMEEAPIEKLAFMKGIAEFVTIYPKEAVAVEHLKKSKRQKLALVLDSPGGSRLGRRLGVAEEAELLYTIDHHISESEIGSTYLVDTRAAAVCELIAEYFFFLEELHSKSYINKAIANNLYLGLLTDTGRFTYSNTTSNTLLVASNLLSYGVNTSNLSLRLFDLNTRARVELLTYVYSHLNFYLEDKMCIAVLPYSVFVEAGASEGDIEGICNILREIEKVELAIFVRETAEANFKASVRSSENFDAQKLAASFEGGGHMRAAGFTITSSFAKSVEHVIGICVDRAKEFMS